MGRGELIELFHLASWAHPRLTQRIKENVAHAADVGAASGQEFAFRPTDLNPSRRREVDADGIEVAIEAHGLQYGFFATPAGLLDRPGDPGLHFPYGLLRAEIGLGDGPLRLLLAFLQRHRVIQSLKSLVHVHGIPPWVST